MYNSRTHKTKKSRLETGNQKSPLRKFTDSSPILTAIIAAISTIIVALVSVFGEPVIRILSSISPNAVLIAGAVILSFLIASIVGGVTLIIRDVNRQTQSTREKIAQAESKVEKQPEKARPAWDLARVTLDSYFNRNLGQITYIFWFSVFVMIIGFGVITWGISQAVRISTMLAPAAITVFAGVITEFIGATFIFIYRSTLQQAQTYIQALERINSVGMAMQILDTIPDETKPDDLKNKTKATLVELLVKQAQITTAMDETEQK